MPYTWLNALPGILGAGLLGAVVLLIGLAIVRGKGRRKAPLRAAMGCLIAFIAVGAANYGLIFLVQLPSLAREHQLQQSAQRLEREETASLLSVGDAAPSIAVTDTEGTRFVMDDLRGKVVLVNFFATWCGPCRLELPHVEQLWQQHRDEGLAVIVIGREETEQSVAAFRTEQGYTFPMAPDPERSVYCQFATELIPRTYLISPAGKICFAASGFNEDSMSQLRSEVDRQLKTLH